MQLGLLRVWKEVQYLVRSLAAFRRFLFFFFHGVIFFMWTLDLGPWTLDLGPWSTVHKMGFVIFSAHPVEYFLNRLPHESKSIHATVSCFQNEPHIERNFKFQFQVKDGFRRKTNQCLVKTPRPPPNYKLRFPPCHYTLHCLPAVTNAKAVFWRFDTFS